MNELSIACEEFAISNERKEQLEEIIFEKELAALDDEEYVKIDTLTELKKQGKVATYYKDLKKLIRQYKNSYREGTLS